MTAANLQQIFEAEQRKRQRRAQLLTAEQRVEQFVMLQTTAELLLASNPAALAAFHKRNRQKRRESRVRELESLLHGGNSKVSP